MNDRTPPPAESGTSAPPLLVACLCAQWCGTCRDYEAVLAQARQQFGTQVAVVQVDIEDDEAWLDGIEVENFPTLLLATADRVLFYGTITPHPQTLMRLVHAALTDELAPARNDPDIDALAQRLRTFPSR